jgi:hypothetical protein
MSAEVIEWPISTCSTPPNCGNICSNQLKLVPTPDPKTASMEEEFAKDLPQNPAKSHEVLHCLKNSLSEIWSLKSIEKSWLSGWFHYVSLILTFLNLSWATRLTRFPSPQLAEQAVHSFQSFVDHGGRWTAWESSVFRCLESVNGIWWTTNLMTNINDG